MPSQLQEVSPPAFILDFCTWRSSSCPDGKQDIKVLDLTMDRCYPDTFKKRFLNDLIIFYAWAPKIGPMRSAYP